jgi:MYXO-CTERM domain-containing protein
MNKRHLPHMAAALVLGAACTMPAMAQDTSSSTTSASPSSSQMAQSSQPSDTSPATQTMGAGPDDMNTNRDDGHRDMGWIGLLGLAGLLGLRRRHHDDPNDYNRTRTTTAR